MMDTSILKTVIGFHTLVIFLPVAALILYIWPQAWHYLLTLFLGLLIAFIDLQTDEVQFPALLLLTFGFFFGFAESRGAWRWAVILGVCLPLAHLLRIVIEGDGERVVTEGAGSLLALVFAFLGTYAGVAIRSAVTRSQNQNRISESKV